MVRFWYGFLSRRVQSLNPLNSYGLSRDCLNVLAVWSPPCQFWASNRTRSSARFSRPLVFFLPSWRFLEGGGFGTRWRSCQGGFLLDRCLKKGRNDKIIHNCDIFLFTGGEKKTHVGVYKLQGKTSSDLPLFRGGVCPPSARETLTRGFCSCPSVNPFGILSLCFSPWKKYPCFFVSVYQRNCALKLSLVMTPVPAPAAALSARRRTFEKLVAWDVDRDPWLSMHISTRQEKGEVRRKFVTALP